ncbi:histidine kinase [Actinoplanes sp. NEAU-A12]|uniref:histidine kinase n=1 Tax=Actinoplanes sandaracinus TaxID=3045177 RepID=A0ABT6X203_9ACTN|nr:histidine kinase [Actinoplanes sandaracinus]MDI6106034.1 histidine kinase [Actinoplanes sandaracinus]
MDRVRAVAGRHPMAVDVGLAVLVAAANVPAAAHTGTGMVGWLWFVVAHLPLVWRRRAPVAVFWMVFAVALTVWTVTRVDVAYPVIVILVGVYALARYRPWRQLWPAAAAVEFTLAVAWRQGELPRTDLVALTAILAATGLLGMTVTTRRAYLAELEERARRLERDRDQQAKLTAAAERARIAREMHDIVTHNLAVMVALADGAALTAAAAPQRAADTLATVATTGRQALGEMQRLLSVLRDGDQAPAGPLGLTPQPGLDDLDQLVEQVRAAGLRVTLVRQGTPGEWGPGAGLAVYRIVQEALTNTLKHAGPRATAQIRLRSTATSVDLEVTDDGTHQPDRPPQCPPVSGHGLPGMIERAAAYGGDVEAGPLPGTGWRVRVRLHFDDGKGRT